MKTNTDYETLQHTSATTTKSSAIAERSSCRVR